VLGRRELDSGSDEEEWGGPGVHSNRSAVIDGACYRGDAPARPRMARIHEIHVVVLLSGIMSTSI
jgi:hypothetical protein